MGQMCHPLYSYWANAILAGREMPEEERCDGYPRLENSEDEYNVLSYKCIGFSSMHRFGSSVIK
ncbi:MAG TPA: hypothetical protein DCZ91_07030 [Lachnospiraceae bacterium]|nr:hypothetical protein [Lachnospiraceae bacterium]